MFSKDYLRIGEPPITSEVIVLAYDDKTDTLYFLRSMSLKEYERERENRRKLQSSKLTWLWQKLAIRQGRR